MYIAGLTKKTVGTNLQTFSADGSNCPPLNIAFLLTQQTLVIRVEKAILCEPPQL